MSAPLNPRFDRYAQMTYGLVGIGDLPQPAVNYLSLATGFMFGDYWTWCSDLPSTTWAACSTLISTSWTQSYTLPATAWTLVPFLPPA